MWLGQGLASAADFAVHPVSAPVPLPGPPLCRLLKRTAPAGRPGLWYVAEQLPSGQLSGKMDHLVCFLPGAPPPGL